MSLNIVFAGNIVDESLASVPGAYIQAYFQHEDTTELWDTNVRVSDVNGDYSLNLGDTTFEPHTDGNIGTIILNVWTGENGRNGLVNSLASIVIPLTGSPVYVNNIQLKAVGPLSCENWTLDASAFRDEVVLASNTNTNERTYVYGGVTHYQNRELLNSVMFDSLGVKTEEYDFGLGYSVTNSYSFSTHGTKTVSHRVTDLYNPASICTKDINIYSQVLGGLNWIPDLPIINEQSTFTPGILFDVDSITNVEYLVDAVSIANGLSYTDTFTYTPTDLPTETITQKITYFNGFESVVYTVDFFFDKTNQAPVVNLEAFKPIPGGTNWSFSHNAIDIDGTVEKVQWTIERNNPDTEGNDIWSTYYDSGILTDLGDFTYDFKDQWGEFKVICTVYDDYDTPGTEEHIFTYDPEVDLSNVDWTKVVKKTTFGVKTTLKSFKVSTNVVKWGVKTTQIPWSTKVKKSLFDTKVNKITFSVKTCNK